MTDPSWCCMYAPVPTFPGGSSGTKSGLGGNRPVVTMTEGRGIACQETFWVSGLPATWRSRPA
jgi:hypothetical protein